MLREPTIDKLKTLRLDGMTAAWLEQQKHTDLGGLGFDERFALLVDAEWTHRDNKKVSRFLKDAKLKLSQACVEGLEYPAQRQLDKAAVRQLASCGWVHEHQSILITGATGTGKSYLACALANQACRRGYKSFYRRASRLLDDFKLAHADGSYPRLLAKLARIEVLVVDDFGVSPMSDNERRDLLEVLDDRYGSRATIVTSQLPPAKWHDFLADPTLADAICDRLLNNAHRLVLHGPSRRKEIAKTS